MENVNVLSIILKIKRIKIVPNVRILVYNVILLTPVLVVKKIGP